MKPISCQSSPFFIVGVQRSGTTMLRLMLNNHPNIAVPFESVFISSFYRKLSEYGDLTRLKNITKLLDDISKNSFVKRGELVKDAKTILNYSIAGYADLVNAIFTVYAKRKGKQRWGDKTPGYITDLDVIWKLFPGCRIIHLVRDGRDVALSQRNIDWGTGNIMKVAEKWKWQNILCHKIGAVLDGCYLEVRYEDLVKKTEDTLRKICTFINEPYCESLLEYNLSAEKEMPETSMKWHKKSIEKPDPCKVYMWKSKMSLPDRIIFERVAGEALKLFGYEYENLPSTLGSKLKEFYYTFLCK